MAIVIYDKATDRRLFELSRAQLDELIEALEEEDEEDNEYYIDEAVCDYLEGRIDDSVLEKLRALVAEAEAPEEESVEEAEDEGEEEEEEDADDEDAYDEDDEYEEDESVGRGVEIYWREE